MGFILACGGGEAKNASPFSGPHTGAVVDIDHAEGRLVSVGDDRVVHLWSWPSLEGTGSIRLKDFGTAVAFSPDGGRLAVGDRRDVVSIWETTGWTRIDRLDHVASALAWSDQRLAVAVNDRPEVAIYDNNLAFVGLLEGHKAPIVDVAFSMDGAYLATASSDRTARVWDVVTGQERQLYAGHKAAVLSVAFSPDGQTLATGSQDKTARLWDIGSGEPQRQLSGHRDWVTSVAFPEDPSYVLTADRSGRYRVWSTSDGAPLTKDDVVDEDEGGYEDALFVGEEIVLAGPGIEVIDLRAVLKMKVSDPREFTALDPRCAKLVECGKTLMRMTDGETAKRGLEIVKMAREMAIEGPTICLNTLVALPTTLGQGVPPECTP